MFPRSIYKTKTFVNVNVVFSIEFQNFLSLYITLLFSPIPKMQLFQYTKDRLLKNDREKKRKEKRERKKLFATGWSR